MEREAKTSGISIKAFRSNNRVFKAAEFRADLHSLDQHITYYGVGAHHQNGIAERYIRTMVDKANNSSPKCTCSLVTNNEDGIVDICIQACCNSME